MDKIKIMIVEDEAIVANDIAKQLKCMGHDVVAIAYSSKIALEKVKKVCPDLVLMDIVLSGEMDGIQVADIIRSCWDIPVIFLTAYADQKLLERAKLVHPYGYMLKPFQKNDLMVTIEMASYVSRLDKERKIAEYESKLNEARVLSLLKISQYKAPSIEALLDLALQEAITLTKSKLGYIYNYDDQKREFILNNWSPEVMKECSITEPQTIYQLEKTGLWGEAVKQGRPVMVNDFQAPHPLKRGYPEGHAHLAKFLTIPVFSNDRIVAVIGVANKQSDYDIFDVRQLTLLMDTVWRMADQRRMELEIIASEQKLRQAVSTTIKIMASTVEARDPYTAGHQLRSANLARAIATEMALPPEKVEGIWMVASIHDIGKLSIPAEILSKPTKLSDIEFSLIKEHASKGYEMLKDVESSWPLAEIVYQHHERLDGSGYPRKLKGKEILIEARILAVADVVEAMASHRPYRASLGIDAALHEIEKNIGIFYDNDVVEACLRLFREKGFKFATV